MSRRDARSLPAGVELVRPSPGYGPGFLWLVEDFRRVGEQEWVHFYRSAVADFETYWKTLLAQSEGRCLPDGWVPCSTWWLAAQDRIVVGSIRVRHRLTPFLEEQGGHIGIDLAPSVRGRGLGSALLALGIERSRDLGLDRVLLVCDATNAVSRRMIESAGAVFADERRVAERAVPVRRYWIWT